MNRRRSRRLCAICAQRKRGGIACRDVTIEMRECRHPTLEAWQEKNRTRDPWEARPPWRRGIVQLGQAGVRWMCHPCHLAQHVAAFRLGLCPVDPEAVPF